MANTFKALETFLEHHRRLSQLISVLNFDLETKAPLKSFEERNKIISFYASERASISENEEFIRLIDALSKEKLNEPLSLFVKDQRNGIEHMAKIGSDRFFHWNVNIGKSTELWMKAKKENDFSVVKEALRRVIEDKKEEAKLLRKPDQKTLYDYFLNEYEKGMNEEKIDAVFGPLKEFLVQNLPTVLKKQEKWIIPQILPHPKHEQEHLALDVLDLIGYDMERGALAETEHPFSDYVARDDHRVTTHYREDWRSSLFSVLHEGGHAIQFQAWGHTHYDNYVDGRASAAMCETHSRFFENVIGRSRAFSKTLLNLCKTAFNSEFVAMTDDEFYKSINVVKPSLIRTAADEYTYCLHIIIRYELERDLINGKLEVDDLPKAWNQKYHDYLGVAVPADDVGVLQDIHWYEGLIGYFPSYALGNIYGTQILSVIKRDVDFEGALERADLKPILNWLNRNDFAIDYFDPDDWIMKVTGQKMDVSYFKSYLRDKYF